MEQPGADPLLNGRHCPGDGRRGHRQAPRRRGESLFFRNGYEDRHRLQAIHAHHSTG